MSAGIRAGSSNDGYVQVNGNDIITALSGGNVGIGNTSPSTKLHVNGTVTATKFIGGFDGNSNISVDDWIVHTSDTDTKLGFPAADQIQFDTGGTNYLKLHRYSSVNFVELGSSAHLSFADNGTNSRGIMIGNGNASSTGQLFLQAGGGSTGFGGGIRLYSHANSTNAGGVYIGKSLNSSGSIIFGNGGTAPSHEYLKINSSGRVSIKSQAASDTTALDVIDNNSSNQIWRVIQAADGDGYMQCLTDEGSANIHLDSSGNSYVNGGYFGVGKTSPGCAIDVLHTADQLVARFLSSHTTLGGGVQVKNNNARGGLEFLYKDGSNQGAFYHSTGGWTWDKELQLVGTAKLRIGTTSGSYLLNVDSGDGTDGHIIASFNGQESSNHAGLNIAHYLCGSDDNRTGLYWEHQNVSNQRMWMGDDLRLYLKASNPTESTAQGRYIMTVESGSADFPDGSSYDNAAKSALEIKKHYPNSQTGNYWIYDYNGTPRQIHCEMEIDGGGWMMWHDHNSSNTSMNEALGGSAASPHSGLGRGNYGNYARYQLLIRASKVGNATREALHTIVQLDHNGNLFRKYDYGEEFFREDAGDPYNPTLNQYFSSGTGEWIGNTQAYGGQCGSSGWTNFGTGTHTVYIREIDSRLAPGDHRSYAMHERVYGFNDNGVPMWRNADSMGVMPYWTDIRGTDGIADGAGLNSSGTSTDNMHDKGLTMYANNGNNGPYLHGRIHGVFLGEFEIAFRLSGWWGWAVGNMGAGIGIAESIRDNVASPYYQNTSYGYAAFGLMNNSSNNLWYPNHFYNGDTSQTVGNSGSGWSGHNTGWNVMWREDDGTIKIRRQDNTHGTYTYGKFVGPLLFGNGTQSPSFTEMGVMWDKPWNSGTGNCMR